MSARTRPRIETIVEAMEGELDPLGYAFVAQCQWFSRFDGHYEYVFDLGAREKFFGLPGPHLRPSVGIRVGPVETFFNRTASGGQEFARCWTTVGLPFMDLAKSRSDMDWTIDGEKSMNRAVKQIMKKFHKLAAPFFKKYGNLEELDSALNIRPDSFDYDLGGPPIDRASRGLIIAKLLARPDFDRLCDIYDRQLTHLSNGYYLQWFRPLVQDLRENGDLLQKMWNGPPIQGGPVFRYDPAEDEPAPDPEDEA